MFQVDAWIAEMLMVGNAIMHLIHVRLCLVMEYESSLKKNATMEIFNKIIKMGVMKI